MSTVENLRERLLHYHPGTEWSVYGDDYGSLEWIGPGTKPSAESLAALEWPPTTPAPPEPVRPGRKEDVIAERARRLAAGFDYDFGDARGVHRIGTTEEDLRGWDEVSKGSSAAVALGMADSPIQIVTDTGPVTITAIEWQMILLAAAAARQPIWAASFALQMADPIPSDFADDSYWP